MTDDDFGSMNDPEASYRRGYQQGACDGLDAGKSMTEDQAREWAHVTLAKWRYENQPDNRNLQPPRPWLKRLATALQWGLPRRPST
jgi:hypothetical protein